MVEKVKEGMMKQHIRGFLDYLCNERGKSANTAAAYQNDLYQLADFVGEGGDTPAKLANELRSLLPDYVAYLKERGYASATIARKIAVARSFFKFLIAKGILRNVAMERLASPRVGKIPPKILSEVEIQTLLNQPKGATPEAKRDQAMMALLYGSSLRISELVALNLADMNLDERCVVPLARGGVASNFTYRISERAVPYLREYLKEARSRIVNGKQEEALFVNRLGGRLTRQGLWQIIKTHAERANLGDKVSPKIINVKRPHHKGKCHQLGYSSGVKVVMILEKTKLGSAISKASGDKTPKTLPGIIPFFII